MLCLIIIFRFNPIIGKNSLLILKSFVCQFNCSHHISSMPFSGAHRNLLNLLDSRFLITPRGAIDSLIKMNLR